MYEILHKTNGVKFVCKLVQGHSRVQPASHLLRRVVRASAVPKRLLAKQKPQLLGNFQYCTAHAEVLSSLGYAL